MSKRVGDVVPHGCRGLCLVSSVILRMGSVAKTIRSGVLMTILTLTLSLVLLLQNPGASINYRGFLPKPNPEVNIGGSPTNS